VPRIGVDEQVEGKRRAPHKPTSRPLRSLEPPQASRSLSTSEAAAELDITERTVRRAIARGELAAVRRGGGYRIDSQELARYAAHAEQHAVPRPAARVTLLPLPDQAFAPLPAPLSSFIGRVAEQAALTALLADPAARLITLTGPGGVGKTRLAITAAASVREHFPDGIVFVALATVFHPDYVVPAIAEALGLQEIAGRDRRAQVHAFLRANRLLLVLDNFEQILAAAPEVARLAAEAPDLTILITSRAPLRVGGERELPVSPMALAREAASLDELAASDAGQLFVARAREHDPSFTLDAASVPHVADICAQLDGLPLAIELAAARAKVLPPRQLRAQLQQRLPLLTGGPRDAPHRHATMRNAIAWSYDLLTPEEQRVFRRLSVFVGGSTLDAATWVSNGAAPLDLLGTLIDQSLLVRETGLDGEPRYRMLETIREYGLDRLETRDEASVRSAHARYFLDLAWQLRSLANTRATHAPLDRFAADEDNVRAALGWLDAHGEPADFVRMVVACYTFLFARSHFREAEDWLERALAKSILAADADRVRLLIGSAELLMVKGQFSRADAAFAETLPLVREMGDPLDLTMALISSGAVLNYDGRYAAGEAHLSEALSRTEAIDDATLRAAVATRALANLSVSARGQGDFDAAAARGEEALRLCHEFGLDLAETRILMDLGDIARDQGDYRLAATRYLACLDKNGNRVEMRLVADVLSGMASIATAWGQHRDAFLLFGAATALREQMRFGMLLLADVATLDRDLAVSRAALGDQEVAAIVREGQALALADAIAIAAAVTPPYTTMLASGDGSRSALTPRERDVLRLLAESRTDREIAEALYLSPRTVSWHVSTILAKLGATSRRDAIAQVRLDGLITSDSAPSKPSN
jgi:excisionase family DNA binding protein